MPKGYFDIMRDRPYPCFCQACLIGKTEGEMSKADKRYCLGCYDCLAREAEMISSGQPRWMPKRYQRPPQATTGHYNGIVGD